ncbi:unnamed protein product [Lathyrus sativus]|nr:unnamed protein product [Lathyrus sativus]
MIKSVLQAILSYVLSLFILSDTVCNDIEKFLKSFWWGGGSNNRGIHWMAWDKLACSKKEGGLGFRDFKAFNMSMVAKQGWSMLSKPQALVSRILKARWNIGDGSYIKVMHEPWIRGKRDKCLSGP